MDIEGTEELDWGDENELDIITSPASDVEQYENMESESTSSRTTVTIDPVPSTSKSGGASQGSDRAQTENDDVSDEESTDTEETITQAVVAQPPETEKSLQEVINALTINPRRETIEYVTETVTILQIPTQRVKLPELLSFSLTFKMSPFKTGSAFKEAMRKKLQNLHRLLFFDKEVDKTQNVLGNLMNQSLADISLSSLTPRCSFLKFDVDDDTVLMKLVKDTELILTGAKDWCPIAKLYLSDCHLQNIGIRKDLLNELVIWNVTGLKNHEAFLKTCPNLNSIAWNRFGMEKINITELKNALKFLYKLSLAKAEILFTTTEDKRTGDQTYLKIEGRGLTELCLDNCTWRENYNDWISHMPQLFPHLEKIYVSGEKVHSILLHHILRVPTIRWIFLFDMAFVWEIVNGKKRVIEESKRILEFLSAVFDKKITDKNILTFLLKKKKKLSSEPSTSAGAGPSRNQDKYLYNATEWRGELMPAQQKFRRMTEIDYDVQEYNKFYSDFDSFYFAESKKSK